MPPSPTPEEKVDRRAADHRALACEALEQIQPDKPAVQAQVSIGIATVHAQFALVEELRGIREALEVGDLGQTPHGLPPQTAAEVVLQRAAATLVRIGLTPEQIAKSAETGAEREARSA